MEHHSYAIYRYMSQLREAGLEFVGMSSVGPSIAIITAKEKREVEGIIRGLGLEIAVITAVDNRGLQVTHHEEKSR